jgi:hypothetical protein
MQDIQIDRSHNFNNINEYVKRSHIGYYVRRISVVYVLRESTSSRPCPIGSGGVGKPFAESSI